MDKVSISGDDDKCLYMWESPYGFYSIYCHFHIYCILKLATSLLSKDVNQVYPETIKVNLELINITEAPICISIRQNYLSILFC